MTSPVATTVTSAVKQGFWKRQGTKIVDYWANIKRDYTIVAKDTWNDCKEKPLKASIYTMALAGLYYSYKTAPSELDMYNELRQKRQQMALIPNSEHNPHTDKELASRSLLIAQNRIHYYNLWFFSLLIRSKHDDSVRIYHTQDANLRKWPWEELWDNVLDVGYWGKWHRLSNKFVDYDINSDEMALLPDGKSL